MPKTFPIRLEVEEVALGTVIRKLNDMAGIAKIDLDLGIGGGKPAKSQQQQQTEPNDRRKTNSQTKVLAFLMDGPKSVAETIAMIGSNKTTYGAMHNLRVKKLIKSTGEKNVYQLTEKAKAGLKGEKPKPAKKTKSGRMAPGNGRTILFDILQANPLTRTALLTQLTDNGVLKRSAEGVLHRARRDKLIKKNAADQYELTNKAEAVTHG